MKKNQIFCLALVTLLILPLLCFASCKPQPEPSACFVAKVTEVGETQLFVTVIDKSTSGLGNGTPVYVSTNFDGYTAPAVGDYVIVKFDSMVQEIYPPIVPNVFAIIQCDANGNPLN